MATVNLEEDASVSSALAAIKFERFNGEGRETLSGNGQQIAQFVAARGDRLEIDAKALVRPEPLCKTYSTTSGAEVIRFSYTNRQSKTLEVLSDGLNQLSSITGQPFPAAEFKPTDESLPDGYYGFEWPINEFIWRDVSQEERVAASWRLLGQVVSLDKLSVDVPLCSEQGDYRGCSPVTDELSEQLFQQALRTVSNISDTITKGLKKGTWKAAGKLRGIYLKGAAGSLRNIRETLRALPKTRYVCVGAGRPTCSDMTYPKQQLMLDFDKLIKFKMPVALRKIKGIVRTHAQQRKVFIQMLGRQPDRFTTCAAPGP